MFTVVPKGMTNFEIFLSALSSSSAVFRVTGIVAIELPVENASVCGLRNFVNVVKSLFATNLRISMYTSNIAPSPANTVPIYAPIPTIDSIPTFDTIPTIKPNTAKGTIFIENIKM